MNSLYPQTNEYRKRLGLEGLWDFAIDSEAALEARAYPAHPTPDRLIAVPGSWNEQFTDLHNYLGVAWYSRTVHLDALPAGTRAFLRVAAACNHSKVWLNGQCAGEYRIGFLPGVFDVTDALRAGENLVVIRVDSLLTDSTLPTTGFGRGHWAGYEMAADYFPYAGIHREVELVFVPEASLVNCKTDFALDGDEAEIRVRLWTRGRPAGARLTLLDQGAALAATTAAVADDQGSAVLRVKNPTLWAPGQPYLHTLRIECLDGLSNPCDRYDLSIGIRTVEVTATELRINGKPVVLRGFSRHEDFPIVGKGHVDAVMVRDFELMKWIGANSFRTSHYPYDERQYQMADRQGVLVIGEAAAVSLFIPKRRNQVPGDLLNDEIEQIHKQMIHDMIVRDWNHPSVIAWSMCNECAGDDERTAEYFHRIYDYTKSLDDTRPAVHTNHRGLLDPSQRWADMVCINHYDFACTHPGHDMQAVRDGLRHRLTNAHEQLNRPVFLSEFGICGIPGFHSLSPQYFTEEGMVDHVMNYLDVARDLPFVIGSHIWLLHDFKAQEGQGRPTQNFKGMFDRLRQPKLIAHLLRQRWSRTERF